MWQYNKCALYILTYNVCVNLREYPNFNLFIGVFSHRWLVYTLNFLPYKPTGPASSNIYRPTINSTGPNLKTTLTTINSNHQNSKHDDVPNSMWTCQLCIR